MNDTKKYFEFHWNDGKVEYCAGISVSDAFKNLGYNGGAMAALDYWKEASELPFEEKQFTHTDCRLKPVDLNKRTMFVELASKEILKLGTETGIIDIRIGIHTWKCQFTIMPFEIRLVDC